METLNFKNLALTMLGVVKNPEAVKVLSQNIVQLANDPSATQYKIDYWPVQLCLTASGNINKSIGKFIYDVIDANMKDVYPDMMDAIQTAESKTLAVMTVNLMATDAGQSSDLALYLTNADSGDRAVVKRATPLGRFSPSLGPNIVFDHIKGTTEYMELEVTGILITVNVVRP